MSSFNPGLNMITLTAMVNEMKKANGFVKDTFFKDHETLPTEEITFDLIAKGRTIAPFVRRGSEGIMVPGYDSSYQTVTAPNIRIKRPLGVDSIYKRRPGMLQYASGQAQIKAGLNAHLAREMRVMNDSIDNAMEWMACQALQGQISYAVQDQEVFTITFPKPGANNVTLSIFWDDANPALVKVLANIHTAKQLLADAVGLTPTDAICGTEAAAALRTLIEGGHLRWTQSNFGQVQAGEVTFNEQISDMGVIYLGTISGVNFWEYNRTADLNGVTTPMIRPKYVEFLSRSAASQRTFYFGAIADLTALRNNQLQAERFSKSWVKEDPSAIMALITARPLPVPRRPGANVSMKVVSG